MNEIQEYNGVEAALNQIVAKYEGRVYDVTTKAGMADAKVARREIRTTRTGLEKLRKELKEPALRRCQLIDSEAKAITLRLAAIEDPIDKMIANEEQRIERERQERAQAEALRIAKIHERIEAFNVMPPWGAKAAEIMLRLRVVSDLPVDDTFAEFQDAAAIAKAQAMTRLTTMHAEAQAIEQEQARLAEIAERNRLALEQERAENEKRLAEERQKAAERLEAERQERVAAQKALEASQNDERERMAREAGEAKIAQQRAAQEASDAERARLLAEARRETAEEALRDIRDVVDNWTVDQISATEACERIGTIVDANLPE